MDEIQEYLQECGGLTLRGTGKSMRDARFAIAYKVCYNIQGLSQQPTEVVNRVRRTLEGSLGRPVFRRADLEKRKARLFYAEGRKLTVELLPWEGKARGSA